MDWQFDSDSVVSQSLQKAATDKLKAIPPFHFPIAFPEVFLRDRPGFDVIIGNPPWEKAKVEEDHFWTRYYTGFLSLTKTEQQTVRKSYLRERPDLVRVFESEVDQAQLLRDVLTHSPYSGMGTGDPDVYKAACWRFWTLVRREGGRISVVLPRSVFCAKGSMEFRSTVFNESTVATLPSSSTEGAGHLMTWNRVTQLACSASAADRLKTTR